MCQSPFCFAVSLQSVIDGCKIGEKRLCLKRY